MTRNDSSVSAVNDNFVHQIREMLTLAYDVRTSVGTQSVVQRNDDHGISVARQLCYDVLKTKRKHKHGRFCL